MKHSGKASGAALKLIGLSAVAVLLLLAAALIGKFLGTLVLGLAGVIGAVWVLFVIFTFYFFRDPDPMPPSGPGLVLAPGHGKVDTIDTTSLVRIPAAIIGKPFAVAAR